MAPASARLLTPEQKLRQLRKAEQAYERRIEDIVVENYDRTFQECDDVFDQETKVKLRGFHDHEKVDEWKNVMHRTFQRRLIRQKEKQQDETFFSKKALSDKRFHQSYYNADKKSPFSRESLELFEIMNKGQQLADQVELQFANQFEDFKNMSAMVGLTAGVPCSDVGITKQDCASEQTQSVQSQTRLR